MRAYGFERKREEGWYAQADADRRAGITLIEWLIWKLGPPKGDDGASRNPAAVFSRDRRASPERKPTEGGWWKEKGPRPRSVIRPEQVVREEAKTMRTSWFPGLAVMIAGLLSWPSMVAAEFRTGAAVADITPEEWPLGLVGSFSPRLADEVHDPLQARSVALSDGETTIALTVVDNCLVRRETLDKAKALASEATGVSTEHMLISATHTHSAPSAREVEEEGPQRAYHQRFVRGVADSIIAAIESLAPGKVGWSGHDLPDEVFNRRWFLKPGTMPANPFGETTDLVKMNPGTKGLIAPAGPIDPEVSVLLLAGADGKARALYANYALHYVGNVPQGQVSADYFGEFARLIGVRLNRSPETGFVGVLSNGTSGDINNINFLQRRPRREPFEQIRFVASKVADAATLASRDAELRDDLTLDMVERVVTLRWRKPDADLLERSRRYLAIEDEKELPRLAKAYAKRIIDLHEGPDTLEAKIQAIRIGDLAICSLPFEVLVEIGLELKEESPFEDTFVVELANGWYGYLPTPEQHEFGGYETWIGTCRVQEDASVILTEQLKEMLAELKERQN